MTKRGNFAFKLSQADERGETEADWDENVHDAFDAREIFDLIKEIRDPEHPMSLEELGYVINRTVKMQLPALFVRFSQNGA